MNAARSLLLAPLALVTLSPRPPAQAPDARAHELFVKNCASCHGETGDGKGTAQLDRPARSFKDGGFSFGNTPEALFRTISVGIPGTPMAGFDASLTADERRLLAGYVVALGPPIEEVKLEDMILVVRDRPLVVRGHLPPLAEGLPHHPRGLLVGDPTGITFEYQVDDVRLLALRQGGYVRRTDWSGRGGTPLEPLGKVVHLVEGGRPSGLFSLAAGAIPLSAHLASTRVDDRVAISYHLMRGAHEVAHVSESPSVSTTAVGTAFSRSFHVTGGSRGVHLALLDPTQAPGARAPESDVSFAFDYLAVQVNEGVTSLHGLAVRAARWSRKDGYLIVDLQPGETADIEIGTWPSAELPAR